jgi:aspartyl-tRNA(Asn)/glutamyl-tRNA(Gln) amidotransferase subunit B
VAKDRLRECSSEWEAVIGLEIHTELTTLATKMFCGCPVAFGGEPNTRVCPVCLGMPGALPVPNEAAIEATVLAGLATGARSHRGASSTARTTSIPTCRRTTRSPSTTCRSADANGFVESTSSRRTACHSGLTEDGDYVTRIGITRIHLEEDTGKMIHVGGSEGRIAGATHSLVDFNRAVPGSWSS